MPAAGDDFEVDFRRSGGFAGIALGATVHSGDLSSEHAEELRRLVDGSDLPALAARPPAAPAGADRFQYDITLRRDAQEHHVRVHDSALSGDLRALATWLEDYARRAAPA